MEQKVSITEIARLAGVSNATVSRVLNHPELVNRETVQLIQDTMESCHYRPRASKLKNTKSLILINVPEIANPFYSEVIRGIGASSENHSYHMLISQENLQNSAAVDNFIALVKKTRASGLILCSSLKPQYYQHISALAPIVQCCEYNREEYSYVSIDDFKAAYSAMEHIYSLGRRKIAIINGPSHFKYACERRQGYEAFLDYAGIEPVNSWYIQLPQINYDMAFSAASQLLSSSAVPDAVFAASDLIAAAVIKAARLHKLRVPEDLAVVGFDNINISTICEPAITTVSQPCFQLGYSAGEILHEQICTPNCAPQHMLLNTELIIRGSTSGGSHPGA